nr:MAG TPA: hypothetical protein [Caudoviricetes sp.]
MGAAGAVLAVVDRDRVGAVRVCEVDLCESAGRALSLFDGCDLWAYAVIALRGLPAVHIAAAVLVPDFPSVGGADAGRMLADALRSRSRSRSAVCRRLRRAHGRCDRLRFPVVHIRLQRRQQRLHRAAGQAVHRRADLACAGAGGQRVDQAVEIALKNLPDQPVEDLLVLLRRPGQHRRGGHHALGRDVAVLQFEVCNCHMGFTSLSLVVAARLLELQAEGVQAERLVQHVVPQPEAHLVRLLDLDLAEQRSGRPVSREGELAEVDVIPVEIPGLAAAGEHLLPDAPHLGVDHHAGVHRRRQPYRQPREGLDMEEDLPIEVAGLPVGVDGRPVVVVAAHVVHIGAEAAQLSVLRAEAQRVAVQEQHRGRDPRPVVALILEAAVRAVALIGLLLQVQQIDGAAQRQRVEIAVDAGAGLLFPLGRPQGAADVVAALLAVFLAGQLLRRDGEHPPVGQEQRLLVGAAEAVRCHRVLADHGVADPEQGVAVLVQGAAPYHHVPLVAGAVDKSRQRVAQDGIAGHLAAVPHQLGVVGVRKERRILEIAVPVDARLVAVAAEEHPVGAAAHAVHRRDGALVDGAEVPLPHLAGGDLHVVLAHYRALPRRCGKGHGALGPIHGEVGVLHLVHPVAVLVQHLCRHGIVAQILGRQLIGLVVLRAEEALRPGLAQKIQPLIGLSAAVGPPGDDHRGHRGTVRHRRQRLSVVYPVGRAVQQIELLVEHESPAPGVGHGPDLRQAPCAVRGLHQPVELRSRVDQRLVHQVVHAVDGRALRRRQLGGVAHPLAHLAHLIPDHVGRRRRTGLVHIAGAVVQIHAPEGLHHRAEALALAGYVELRHALTPPRRIPGRFGPQARRARLPRRLQLLEAVLVLVAQHRGHGQLVLFVELRRDVQRDQYRRVLRHVDGRIVRRGGGDGLGIRLIPYGVFPRHVAGDHQHVVALYAPVLRHVVDVAVVQHHLSPVNAPEPGQIVAQTDLVALLHRRKRQQLRRHRLCRVLRDLDVPVLQDGPPHRRDLLHGLVGLARHGVQILLVDVVHAQVGALVGEHGLQGDQLHFAPCHRLCLLSKRPDHMTGPFSSRYVRRLGQTGAAGDVACRHKAPVHETGAEAGAALPHVVVVILVDGGLHRQLHAILEDSAVVDLQELGIQQEERLLAAVAQILQRLGQIGIHDDVPATKLVVVGVVAAGGLLVRAHGGENSVLQGRVVGDPDGVRRDTQQLAVVSLQILHLRFDLAQHGGGEGACVQVALVAALHLLGVGRREQALAVGTVAVELHAAEVHLRAVQAARVQGAAKQLAGAAIGGDQLVGPLLHGAQLGILHQLLGHVKGLLERHVLDVPVVGLLEAGAGIGAALAHGSKAVHGRLGGIALRPVAAALKAEEMLQQALPLEGLAQLLQIALQGHLAVSINGIIQAAADGYGNITTHVSWSPFLESHHNAAAHGLAIDGQHLGHAAGGGCGDGCAVGMDGQLVADGHGGALRRGHA